MLISLTIWFIPALFTIFYCRRHPPKSNIAIYPVASCHPPKLEFLPEMGSSLSLIRDPKIVGKNFTGNPVEKKIHVTPTKITANQKKTGQKKTNVQRVFFFILFLWEIGNMKRSAAKCMVISSDLSHDLPFMHCLATNKIPVGLDDQVPPL